MTYRTNRILIAALVASFPLLATAQSANIVPPPTPPGVPVQKAAVPAVPAADKKLAEVAVASPVSQSSPVVLPPTAVTAPTATGAAASDKAAVQGVGAQPALIDIALPAAPKAPKDSALKADLKPGVPGVSAVTAKAHKTKVTPAKKADEGTVVAKASKDPFAGVAGMPVSDSQLNRFVFPEPVEGVYFQEGSPLPECPAEAKAQDPCKPVFLNGRRVMLLQLRAGAKDLFQMMVHLASGRIESLNLRPSAGPGALIRIDGAEDGASDARLAAAAKTSAANTASGAGLQASEQDVELLSRFARGDIPAGFEPVGVGPAIRFDLFDVIPMATWSNGNGGKAHLMQVRPHTDTPVAVSPALFRNANVRALALDRETITRSAPATLFILESVPEGQ